MATKLTEIKKINVWSLTKIYIIIMAITGFLRGILELIAGRFTTTIVADPMNIIYYPVLYAITGLIIGALGSWLYNLISKYIGGVKVELGK